MNTKYYMKNKWKNFIQVRSKKNKLIKNRKINNKLNNNKL